MAPRAKEKIFLTQCPKCQEWLCAESDWYGDKGRCPFCRRKFLIGRMAPYDPAEADWPFVINLRAKPPGKIADALMRFGVQAIVFLILFIVGLLMVLPTALRIYGRLYVAGH